jgi:hypothetical protein
VSAFSSFIVGIDLHLITRSSFLRNRASLLSTNGFKIPRAGSGVLIGGDITKPEMRSVAKGFVDLGFKLYCSSGKVEQFLNSIPYVKAQKIFFPLKDKRKLNEVGLSLPLPSYLLLIAEIDSARADPGSPFLLLQVFEEHEIQTVINLARQRGRDTVDEDYVARRNAVDFGKPPLFPLRSARSKIDIHFALPPDRYPAHQQRPLRSALRRVSRQEDAARWTRRLPGGSDPV